MVVTARVVFESAVAIVTDTHVILVIRFTAGPVSVRGRVAVIPHSCSCDVQSKPVIVGAQKSSVFAMRNIDTILNQIRSRCVANIITYTRKCICTVCMTARNELTGVTRLWNTYTNATTAQCISDINIITVIRSEQAMGDVYRTSIAVKVYCYCQESLLKKDESQHYVCRVRRLAHKNTCSSYTLELVLSMDKTKIVPG